MPAQSTRPLDDERSDVFAAATQPGRRSFLEWLLATLLVVTGATFVRPVLSYLSPRKSGKGAHVLLGTDGRSIPYARLATEPTLVGMGVDGEPTIVVTYAGETRAFSAVCTHLGCLVKWEAAKAEFICPCHNGHFDANGINVAGPPPKPLKRFKVYATDKGEIGLEEVSA